MVPSDQTYHTRKNTRRLVVRGCRIIKANRKFKNLSAETSAYTQLVGGLVALLLTIIIGVLVFWEVSDSVELGSDDANESKNETLAMASTVFALLPLIALVSVAAIILAVVMGFGGGGEKM